MSHRTLEPVIDLTDSQCEPTDDWQWVEEFRITHDVPSTIEDPMMLANLAQALLTHARAAICGLS